VCSLGYLACNVHVPYCHLWPAPLYNISPHYLINDMNFFLKKLLNTKCVFWFPLQLLLIHFPFKEEVSKIWQKMSSGLHIQYPLFLSVFNETMRLESSWQFFKKYSNIKFHENPSSGSWVVPYGWTDMMKLTVTFHKFVNTPKGRVV